MMYDSRRLKKNSTLGTVFEKVRFGARKRRLRVYRRHKTNLCGYVWKGLTNLHPRVLLLGRENLGTRLGPYLPDISSDAKITSQIFLAV